MTRTQGHFQQALSTTGGCQEPTGHGHRTKLHLASPLLAQASFQALWTEWARGWGRGHCQGGNVRGAGGVLGHRHVKRKVVELWGPGAEGKECSGRDWVGRPSSTRWAGSHVPWQPSSATMQMVQEHVGRRPSAPFRQAGPCGGIWCGAHRVRGSSEE